MKNVEIAFDIDPKSFVKSSRKCAILDIDYYNELKAKVEELERLARIGRATKKLCECYGGTIACHFENIEDLLNWAESEGE